MSNLHCIPPDKSEQCSAPAVWRVWFKDLFPDLYTYACDRHLEDYIERWKGTDTPVRLARQIDGDEVKQF